MEGNRGLVYVRVMRTGSAVLYGSDYVFEFATGHRLRSSPADKATIISSGRGVHEALGAAKKCAEAGIAVGVVDMPSIDEKLLLELYNSGQWLVLAEQNNGYIWQNLLKVLYRNRGKVKADGWDRIITINALKSDGQPQFIHSGTYEELIEAFHLTPDAIAHTIQEHAKEKP
jgi:transketolase C-terminal domain/subunit